MAPSASSKVTVIVLVGLASPLTMSAAAQPRVEDSEVRRLRKSSCRKGCLTNKPSIHRHERVLNLTSGPIVTVWL